MTPATRDSADLLSLPAVELAAGVAADKFSAAEVLEAYLARIDAVNPRVNAIVVPLFDEARKTAQRIDEARRRGTPLGPLAGVPITIKDCFDVIGTPTTLGIGARKQTLATTEGPIVRQLRAAGGVIVGKTNVPQIMLSYETDNRVFGPTKHPERDDRVCGGSSGGEGAAIGARMAAVGLGSDLLGSIRQPAHVCGVHGFKPTMGRYSMIGAMNVLGGMEAIMAQPGPLARHMADVSAFMQVLAHSDSEIKEEIRHHGDDPYAMPYLWSTPAPIDFSKLRVGVWDDDPVFTPSPAIRRVVREAADALRKRGAEIVSFKMPESERAWTLCLALIAANGGRTAKRLLAGEKPIPQIARTLHVWRLPGWQRAIVAGALDLFGQPWRAKLVRACRGCSAADYWELVMSRKEYVRDTTSLLDRERIDLLLAPPHGLPALLCNTSTDTMTAGVYSFIPNLLGLPAGTVAASRIRPGEHTDRRPTREVTAAAALRVEEGSVGLPIGVQVAGRLWRDDVCLAAMHALEAHFSAGSDYPLR